MSCPPGDVAGKTEQQYEKTEYGQGPKGRTGNAKHNKTIFGAVAAVCGMDNIVGRCSTYDVVVLVPCYPVGHPLPALSASCRSGVQRIATCVVVL